MSLREGCKEVLKADCVDLAQRLYRAQRHGIKVEDDESRYAKCAVCEGPIISPKPSGGVVVFFCKHFYHQGCIRGGNTNESIAKETPPSPIQSPSSSHPSSSTEDDERTLWCTICMQSKKNRPSRVVTQGRKLGGRGYLAE
jgi:hypothetical protein